MEASDGVYMQLPGGERYGKSKDRETLPYEHVDVVDNNQRQKGTALWLAQVDAQVFVL